MPSVREKSEAMTWPLPNVTPRPYQQEALGRMVERGNQLLALTMGAGKTLTGVAAVEHLSSAGEVASGFVFCPNSIKFQWLNEIRRHTRAPVQVIDGSRDERRYQYKWARQHRYNVANYDTLRNDVDMVRHIYGQPDFVIADEATQIKSSRSKRSRVLKGWTRDVPYRYALTGQPIENRPEELFSIMEFVDREVLGQFLKFDRTFILRDHFGRPTRYRNMDVLKRAMEPVMFRRSRKDIEAYLPKINRLEMPVVLSPHVMNLYRFIAADTLVTIQQMIESGSGGWNVLQAYGRADETSGRGKGEVMSRLTCMRLLCDNPALLVRSAEDFDDTDSSTGSKYASWLLKEGWLDGLVDDTKMEAAVDLIEEIMDEAPENRVVLFAYFKPMLRMLAKALRERKILSTMLTGDMHAQARRNSLEHFRTDTRVLLSSDAGQYGVDLPQANYLISYDLPWSAGAFAQRVARIDRTSSQFGHINVITMMAAHTIEVRQYEMLGQKAKVAEAWLDARHIDAKGGLTLTLGTLKEFLEAA